MILCSYHIVMWWPVCSCRRLRHWWLTVI